MTADPITRPGFGLVSKRRLSVNPGMLAESHPAHPGLIKVMHWDSIDAYCVECEKIHQFSLRTKAPMKGD